MNIDDQEEPLPTPSSCVSHNSAISIVGKLTNTGTIVEDNDDSPTSVAVLIGCDRHGLLVNERGEVDGEDNKRPSAVDEEPSSSGGVPSPPLAPDPLRHSSDDDLFKGQLPGEHSDDYLAKVSHEGSTRPMSEGEIRSVRQGILSRQSAANFVLIKQILPDDSNKQTSARSSAITKAKLNKPGRNKIAPFVVFKQQSEDILTEGQYYLGISMLVYMYSYLRETCLLGHTRVKMEDIDVNSHHSHGLSGTKKFLEYTKSAGSIVQVLVDEFAQTDDDGEGEGNKSMENDMCTMRLSRRSSITMDYACSSGLEQERYARSCSFSRYTLSKRFFA